MGAHAKTGRRRGVGTFRVRCLGPGPEHTFLSTDRVKHRVCPRCVAALKAMRLSPTMGQPAHDYNDNGQESQQW